VKTRARKRLACEIVAPNGNVRGYHGRCPLTPRPFLGTYTLCLDDDGHICCYGCGAHDLGPTESEPVR